MKDGLFQVQLANIIMRNTQRENSSQRLASLSTLFPVSGIKSRAIRKSRLFLCNEEKTGLHKQKNNPSHAVRLKLLSSFNHQDAWEVKFVLVVANIKFT